MQLAPHSPKQNRLLAALRARAYGRVLDELELVPLPMGWAVHEAGGKQGYLYFPTTSIVSLLNVMENGASTEVAVVGNDGVVGVSLFMGGDTTSSRALVQSAGYAYRLRASALRAEFDQCGDVHRVLMRYTQALFTQMAQTAACYRHHSVEQQLCRWLLQSLDRLDSNRLVVTQVLIASMLGVRREGVTEAAGRLQADGLINYRRGKIEVLDRPGLEHRACECYASVRRESERLWAHISQI